MKRPFAATAWARRKLVRRPMPQRRFCQPGEMEDEALPHGGFGGRPPHVRTIEVDVGAASPNMDSNHDRNRTPSFEAHRAKSPSFVQHLHKQNGTRFQR